MKTSNYFTQQIEKMNLTNVLVISQDNETGHYHIINGKLPSDTSRLEFRNGRWFGFHSDTWVAREVNKNTAHHGYNTPGCNTPKVFINLKADFDSVSCNEILN